MEPKNNVTHESLAAFHRWHWIVALLLLLLLFLLPWLFGIGPNSWRSCLPAAPAAAVAPAVVAPTPTPLPARAEPVAVPAPAAQAETIPSARVYFALDKFDIPTDADRTLADVIGYLKAHPDAKAVLSGFHDPRGSVARNEELALNRPGQ